MKYFNGCSNFHYFRSKIKLLLFFLLLASVSCQTVLASPTRKNASSLSKLFSQKNNLADEWYGVYFGQTRIGYYHSVEKRSIYKGKPAIYSKTDSTEKMIMLGHSLETSQFSSAWINPNSGAPYYSEDLESSGGASTKTTATYFSNRIEAVQDAGGSKIVKSIPIPAGKRISGDDFDDRTFNSIAHGKPVELLEFDEASLKLNTVTFSIEDMQAGLDDSVMGRMKNLVKTRVTYPIGNATAYLNRKGDMVLMNMPLGIVIRRENPPKDGVATKQKPFDINTADMALSTAVTPTGLPISKPRECTALKALITLTGHKPEYYLLHASVLKRSSDRVSDASSDPALAPYIKNASYLSLDNDLIKTQAKQLCGDETNLSAIAIKTRNWVHLVMTPDYSMGTIRDAVDVLKRRHGVCRDYALLYTALARAQGVPTKYCSGVIFADGKFFYHAWAESYIGKDAGWVAVDTTLPMLLISHFKRVSRILFLTWQMWSVKRKFGSLTCHTK
jgi:cell division protein FtsL